MARQNFRLLGGAAVLLVAALFFGSASAQNDLDYQGPPSEPLPAPATEFPAAVATGGSGTKPVDIGCCQLTSFGGAKKCYDTNQVSQGQLCCKPPSWWHCATATWIPGDICQGGSCVKPGGNGDPHFFGFDGTKYDFHGHAGQTYVILSEPSHQVNSLFIPSNPDDTVQPGTYMGIISLMVSNDIHMALEVKGYRYMQVTVNGKVHELTGESMHMEETFGPVTLKTEHRYEEVVNAAVVSKATIETPLFKFVVWASMGNKFNNGTAISAAPVENLHETPYLAFSMSILKKLPGGAQSLHGLVGQSLPWISQLSSSADLTSTEVVDNDYFPRPSNIEAFQKHLASVEDWFTVKNIWDFNCKINRFAQKAEFEAATTPLKKSGNLVLARRALIEDSMFPVFAKGM